MNIPERKGPLAGWTAAPGGKWISPITRREHTFTDALALAAIKPNPKPIKRKARR